MALTPNRTQNPVPAPLSAAGAFPLGAVPGTASRGAAGSRPGGAAVVTPPGLQGALCSELREHTAMAARPTQGGRRGFASQTLGQPIAVPQQDSEKTMSKTIPGW